MNTFIKGITGRKKLSAVPANIFPPVMWRKAHSLTQKGHYQFFLFLKNQHGRDDATA